MRATGPGWLMLGGLLLFGALAVGPYLPRHVNPASSPPETFSAERALPRLEAIAAEPHPTGSPANARVRDYLLGELGALGMHPELQHAAVFRAPTGDVAVVDNVLARLPGTAPAGAVLVTAHYDSVVNAPAAGDDGIAVASMLETLRALRSGPPLSNDLIFLFNDGEELGMYGSQAFIEQHPWAADVRLVLDFDADSPTGATTLSWATPGDGWLLGQIARSNSGLLMGPIENRKWRQAFQHDLHVFAAAGYSGLHFDRVGGSTMYHTDRDSLANLELAALQHQGDVMLALARHFGSIPLSDTRADDVALVSAFGLPWFGYPLSWALPLAGAAGLGLVFVVTFGMRRRRLQARRLLAAALTLGVAAVSVTGAAQAIWIAAIATHPEAMFFAESGFYGQSWLLGSLYALIVGAVLSGLPWVTRRFGVVDMLTVGVGGMVVLSIGFALTEPDVAYQATWPALLGLLSLLYLIRTNAAPGRTPHMWRYTAVLFVPTVPIAGVLAGSLFEPIVGGLSEGPVLVIPALIVVMALLTPQLALATQAVGKWLPIGALGIGCGLLAMALRSSGFSPAQPRPDVLAYALDADTGTAYWLTVDAPLDDWNRQLLAGASRYTVEELLGAPESLSVVAASAPAAALPAPTLGVTDMGRSSDGSWSLRLHVASPRHASRLHVYGSAGTQIVAANLEGGTPQPIEGNQVLISGLISGLMEGGIDVRVEIRGAAPARFTLLDRSSGLPLLPGLPPRPPTVMSAPVGEDLSAYPTLVRASFTVPIGD